MNAPLKAPRAVVTAQSRERERIVEEGIREILARYQARRACAKDYWLLKRTCRTRPHLACQRIFPTRGGDMLDAYEAKKLAKEEWREMRGE